MGDRSQSHDSVAQPLPDSYQTQDDQRPNHQLEELRREYSSEYSVIMSAMREDEKRRIIAALVNHDGLTYDDLDAATAVSRRRMRDRVYDLKDKGIVETTDSNITFVHFTNEDIKLLAEDTLSFFFD